LFWLLLHTLGETGLKVIKASKVKLDNKAHRDKKAMMASAHKLI